VSGRPSKGGPPPEADPPQGGAAGAVEGLRRQARTWPSTQRRAFEEAADRLREALEQVQAAEEALQAQNDELGAAKLEADVARQRYQELFDFAPAAQVVTDLSGSILEANLAAATLLGLPQTSLFGKPLPRFVPTPLRRDLRTKIEEVVSESTVRHFTTRIQPRSGDAVDVSASVGVFRDPDGKRAELRWLLLEVDPKSETQAVARRLRKLQTITDALLAHVGLDDLLRELLQGVRDALGSDTATILLLTPDGKNLAVRSEIGEEASEGQIRVPWGQGVAGRIAAERRARIVPDVPKAKPYSEFLRKKIRSLVGVPLVAGDEVLGVVHSGTFQSREFTEEDVHLLELVAERAAVVIENARLYEAQRSARQAAEETVRRLAALQSVTAALSEAVTTDEVAQVVVEGATSAAGAAAGMIALVSDDGEMLEIARAINYPQDMLARWARFPIASRLPLSDAVRMGRPVIIESMADRERRYPDLVATLDLPDHGLAAVPMLIEGHALGGMVFRFAGPRKFDEAEIQFMLSMARQSALALERARLYEAERRARSASEVARFRVAFLAEASEVLTSSLDYEVTLRRIARLAVPRLADWCLVDLLADDGSIRQMAVAHRDQAKERLARELRDRYPPDPETEHPVWKVLRSGRPLLAEEVTEEELAGRARDARHLEMLRELGIRSHIVVPMAARGRVLGAISLVTGESGRRFGRDDLVLAQDLGRRAAVAVDNAQLYRAEQDARVQSERAQRRMEFLSEATASLSAAVPDYEATLERVARLAVPALADVCLIDVVEDDGTLRRVTTRHADPIQSAGAQSLGRFPLDPTRPDPALAVLQSGQPLIVPEVPRSMTGIAQHQEHLALLRSMGASSLMILPLTARLRALGTITFVTTSSGRTYGDEDRALAEELARRAALVVDNARLYERQRHIAHTLQQSLLPPSLPQIPGIDVATRYRAAGEGIEVGGDFYDIFETAEGGWLFTIGDVCGKGPEAAAVTGLARHTLRAVSLHDVRPSTMLAMLNESILQVLSDDRFCTVCCVRMRAGSGSARLTMCSGGHPLPLILRASGEIETAGRSSMLLGVLPDVELTDHVVDLKAGDTMVMFTDGVIEEARNPDRSGPERLTDVLSRCAGLSASEIAESIEHSVVEFGPESPRDDFAILVLRVKESAASPDSASSR